MVATDPARLIWVTPEAPARDGGGGQLRQANLLLRVADRHPTHLVVPASLTDGAVRAALDAVTEVPHDPPPPLTTWPRRKARLLRHHLTERLPWDEALATGQRRHLGNALRDVAEPGDVIVLEHLLLAPLLRELPAGVRSVLTVHYDVARQAAQRRVIAPTRRNARFWHTQERRAHGLQRWAREHADVLIAVSDDDAAALRADAVVPNGVDLDAFVPTPLPVTRRVVLTATLDYAPNVDGALWFVREVWPRVRASHPDATLEVVGRRPLPEIRALDAVDGVSVHPDVPAIQPHLEAARAAVVPLRLGGGTRLKALEALAAGRVLIGTSTGLEGLGLADGVHALIADDPHVMARHVLGALDDDELAGRLTAAGRRHVEQRYGWDAIADRFLEVVTATGRAGA